VLFMGILTSILGALVSAVILWILCALSGRFINPHFRMTVLHHCITCVVIAIPTVVLMTVFFLCGKAIRIVAQIDTGITKVMMTDGKFVDQLYRQINKTASTADTEAITDWLTQYLAENISSEYPILEKYIDRADLLDKSEIKIQLSGILQGTNKADVGNVQQLIQAAISGVAKNIMSKIRSVRRMALGAVILLHFIAFGSVFYRAVKYRNIALSANGYEDLIP